MDEVWSRNEKRRWLLTLFLGTSALYASRTSVPLAIPEITKERGWSKKDSGMILSSFFWGYTLTQVFGGYLSDRIGGQKVILIAGIGWCIVTFFMPQMIWLFSDTSISVNFIVFIRVLHGAFQGVHFPSMSSLTAQKITEKERASFFSILTSGSAVGTLFTGVVGSNVLEYYGWPFVFYCIGSLVLLWILLLNFYALSLNRRKNNLYLPSKPHPPLYIKESLPVPWMRLFTNLSFWSCVLGHTCQNNCFFLLLSWLPTYFHDMYPDAKGWIVNMVPWLFCIPCTFFGSWMSEKLISNGYGITATRKITEVFCLGLQAIGLVLIPLAGNYKWALVWVSLAIGSTGFHNNAILVNPQDLAPKHSGSVFGLMNTVGAIPGFLGVYLAGYVLETTKSWEAVFQTTAAINLIGCVMYVIFGSGDSIV
ncbi:solute carrier family 17 member 9 [Schistocerca piceifrons]|uniref:solute carrier family 17 member 9 n=1 Tax=Schistocerca piceifrons TaxID=274613 RepID=UPI001F5FD3DA|nr:solute carrier family 17 member 9 [Schistocerca piceifrons]XP_049803153.1 solute carrier family 17 member 9 [Schistocerca nitens]